MDEMLPKVYDPHEIEGRWLERWLPLSHADSDSTRPPFSIVIPPPNVTGVLHMGHALNNTLQDILCRYKRMKGFNVLWVPGTDHAGIATQNVVEKKLAAEGRGRNDLGREAFVEEVWRWKEKHGGHIIHQLKRLGASCDWERERFTMDEGLSRAVREAFVRLFEAGLIYRDLYLVNWCPRCLTAISDIEVEHQETEGHLWYIRYPFVGAGSPRPGAETAPLHGIVVATTRPETMLGDSAIAVHPDDERYSHLIGMEVTLPIADRQVPVIADHRVDPGFGTGAVKVTPAHDFNDFEIGNEHKLERINIFTPDGRMNENTGRFRGLDRFECRKEIVDLLEKEGLLEKVEKHKLSVGHCYRCRTVVEPYLSLQWFVRTAPLAREALGAVSEGKTRFHPENWTATFEQWMENIKDWCISRQIWWGHRIPAWYCVGDKECKIECKEPIVSREAPASCPRCGSKNLRQDTDVLDTWFSSALWPFSTLGWPDKTPELDLFYPTSVLVTAFDIIFFWVARMMMMGIRFMNGVPFVDVYIHSIVRDAEGKKMSKSKGNVIDPLEIMDKFGTDAFRFTLASLATQGRDIRLSEEVIGGHRNFCNKIWNASRFVLMNLEGFTPAGRPCLPAGRLPPDEKLSQADRWILFKLGRTIEDVTKAIEAYHFDDAAFSAYHFFWHTFCDWYIEIAKKDLAESGDCTREVLYHVLDCSFRILHPMMPFITDEISSKLPGPRPAFLDGALWPENRWGHFMSDAEEFDSLVTLVSLVRTIRSENNIRPSDGISVCVAADDPCKKELVARMEGLISFLTKAVKITDGRPKERCVAHGVLDGMDVYVPLEGLIDAGVEKKRLGKEIGKLEADEKRIDARLASEDFLRMAPPDIVAEEKGKKRALEAKINRLRETYVALSS